MSSCNPIPRLTPEQDHVARRLRSYHHNEQVQTLGGYAGTGKTTILAVLAEALPGWAPCAFTGKAAHVMRQKGISRASTIHSLIYTPVPLLGGGVEFRLRTRHEIGCTGFLVDEASMIGRDLYRDLRSFELPIIFIGDHGQLPPVGSDINVMAKPTHRLETIHRNAGHIAHFAEHLRQGKRPRKFDGGDAVRVIGPHEVTDDVLLDGGQIICGFNKARVGLNATVRRLRGRAVLLVKGDRVICLRNSRTAGLFNGQQGLVTFVYHGRPPRFDFRSDEVDYPAIRFDPKVFGDVKPTFNGDPNAPHPFDYAYAVTCHKAQGSEWNSVIAYESPPSDLWPPARWNYTAASRARKRLVWVHTG